MTPTDSYRAKIVSLEELAAISAEAAKRGRRRVLCHGRFEVTHPGHMRHLEWARKQGDLLFVTISEDTGDEAARIPIETRLEYVAALYMVDHVARVPCRDATLSVDTLRPDVLVRGREFQTLRRQIAERERAALSKYGGELLFSSGLGGYSMLAAEERGGEEEESPQRSLQQLVERRGLKFSQFDEAMSEFPQLNVAVIGDCIVDEYIFCDALGMSAEDPVIVVRPQASRRYIGGAAIVAEHASALGAHAEYFSVVGKDAAAAFARQHADQSRVEYLLLEDTTRPTTLKQRFLAAGKKLLRVSYLEERPLSEELAARLVDAVEERIENLDLVIFSDFSYGVNTPFVIDRVCDLARDHGLTITADVQCSSQIATVCKYKGVDLITPTEREARMSLWDMDSGLVQIGLRLLAETGNRDVIIKLGKKGLLTLRGRWNNAEFVEACTEYLTSFADDVKDPMGAGDALLAASSLALAAGADIFAASVLGNVAAAEAVRRVGNLPVTREQIERRLAQLLEPLLEMSGR